MSHNDHKPEIKAGDETIKSSQSKEPAVHSLADILAKQKAPVASVSTVPTIATHAVESDTTLIGVTPLNPQQALKASGHAFRVFNHPYQFKFNGKVLKPTKDNIYLPADHAEYEFLRYQVERGNIHFY